jgi:hypothetical protein
VAPVARQDWWGTHAPPPTRAFRNATGELPSSPVPAANWPEVASATTPRAGEPRGLSPAPIRISAGVSPARLAGPACMLVLTLCTYYGILRSGPKLAVSVLHRFPLCLGEHHAPSRRPHRGKAPRGPRSPENSVADAIRALNSVLPASPARAGRLRPVDPRLLQLLNRRSHQAHRTAQHRTAQHRTAQHRTAHHRTAHHEPLSIESLTIESLSMNRSASNRST